MLLLGELELFESLNSSHDTSYHWTLWTLPTSKLPNKSLKAVGDKSTSPEWQTGHLSTISTTTSLDPWTILTHLPQTTELFGFGYSPYWT